MTPTNPQVIRNLEEAISGAIRSCSSSHLPKTVVLTRVTNSVGIADDLLNQRYAAGPGEDDVPVHVAELVSDRRLRALTEVLRSISLSVADPDALETQGRELDSILREIAADVQVAAKGVAGFAQSGIEKLATRALDRLAIQEVLDEARDALQETREAQAKAERAAMHVRDVAGEEGATVLGEHFARFAHTEAFAANVLRGLVILLLVGVAAAAYFLVGRGDPTLEHVAQKSVITLPILLLAGYAARESSIHREVSRWAGTVEVQLRTIQAFTDPLHEDQASRIREAFGAYVFGPTSSTDVSSKAESRLVRLRPPSDAPPGP